MIRSFNILIITICALPFFGKAQSFEWESEVEDGLSNVPTTKIIETIEEDFILVGAKNISTRICKFNNFGKLIWEISPSIRSGDYIDNVVSFDNFNSFFMTVVGTPFPSKNNFFSFNSNGYLTIEKVTVTNRYHTINICDRLYKGKIVTGGYGFSPQPYMNPVIEFRSTNGDTLGKFEYFGNWHSKVRKVYITNNDTEFLLFCSQNNFGKLTTIRIDTLGNILKANFWGPGSNFYECNYYDMVEKNHSYYMLVRLTNSKMIERGTYLYKFNEIGDSLGLTKVDGMFNTINSTPDNGLILAKHTLLKLDSNMNVEWEKPFKEGVEIQSVGAARGGGYFGSGRRYDKNDNTYRTYVFKTNLNGDIESNNDYPDVEIYPNPFDNKINFELPFGKKHYMVLYDLHGKKCSEAEAVGSTYLILENLPKGVYLLHLLDENKNPIQVKKMLKLE
jgi:hypothetical protein